MSWDYGFFIPKNNVFRKPESHQEKNIKSINCSKCSHPIGVVSSTLYEIDGKCYCSDCYEHIVGSKTVDREPSDIKSAKEELKPLAH